MQQSGHSCGHVQCEAGRVYSYRGVADFLQDAIVEISELSQQGQLNTALPPLG
jgi:hypothetical protein